MDLTQNKLSKSEWESIEIPISENEKSILNIIIEGYNNLNIRFNENQSILQFSRIHSNSVNEINAYYYKEYFSKCIESIVQKLNALISTKTKKNKNKTDISQDLVGIETEIKEMNAWLKSNEKTSSVMKKIKKIDLIRIENMAQSIQLRKQSIFEFILLDFCEKIVCSLAENTDEYGFYLYTLIQLKDVSIKNINPFVIQFVEWVIKRATEKTNIAEVFHRSPEFIEKNKYLLKYQDISLFTHQKQLFSLFRGNQETPKLVLYMAPTGTGKTLSPLGLAIEYKIIFVCVARHVGLALAKSAISMGKKVAFAFGCETASDIRLHYFSAVNFSIHNKSGGIYKVDNSVGTNVEIMICDVKSYLTAMHYMLAFNLESEIITYWDEPTITMDYEEHDLHAVIHKNWVENRISKVVLSCATLPKEEEIIETIQDFRCRFENAEIKTITSFDCKKTISIINRQGKCSLPHLLFKDFGELKECVNFCEKNKTILRYFDLEEIIRFIEYVNISGFVEEPYTIKSYFHSIHDIQMDSIKSFYLDTIKNIRSNHWSVIYLKMTETQEHKFRDRSLLEDPFRKVRSMDSTKMTMTTNPLVRMSSVFVPPVSAVPVATEEKETHGKQEKGTMLTTADAHTLTDGPTIYLVEDVEKIGDALIQQTDIPEKIFGEIMEKILENERIQRKMAALEKSVEDTIGSDIEKNKKMEKNNFSREVSDLMNKISVLQSQIQIINMEPKFVPNTRQHQMLWIPNGDIVDNAFVPMVEDTIIKEIMSVDVNNNMKLLLLLGIGVFTNRPNIRYMEIIKRLASTQKLYIIIAQSDYIYGTNYQFCHGFIGEDLDKMTQQKTIQAMGRIGRNNIQQEYTVRFRDDSIIRNLFKPVGESRGDKYVKIILFLNMVGFLVLGEGVME